MTKILAKLNVKKLEISLYVEKVFTQTLAQFIYFVAISGIVVNYVIFNSIVLNSVLNLTVNDMSVLAAK